MYYSYKTNYKLLNPQALDSSSYINTLFLEIAHTNDECSLPVMP